MRMTNSCLRWRLESLQRLENGCPFPLQVGGKVYILMLQKPKDDNAHRQVRNHLREHFACRRGLSMVCLTFF